MIGGHGHTEVADDVGLTVVIPEVGMTFEFRDDHVTIRWLMMLD